LVLASCDRTKQVLNTLPHAMITESDTLTPGTEKLTGKVKLLFTLNLKLGRGRKSD
jgi:hypothetical protein